MVIAEVFALVGFAFILVKSTELVMGAIKKLSTKAQIGQFGLTAFLLAFATSLPELVVGIVASVEHESALVLGNVLGSNIADLSLVIGGAAFAGGGFRVMGQFLRRDLFLTFFAGALPLLLLLDSGLSRLDGLVLLVVYAVYVVTVLREKSREIGEEELKEPALKRFFSFVNRKHVERDFGKFLLGVGLLLFASHMIVQLAESIATGFGVPVLLIGLFLVAVGTSLPELAFQIRAVRERRISMALGDLLGSVVANSTFILGVSALISPMRLNGGLTPYLYATMGFVVIFMSFWVFVSTKKKLEKWEGVALIAMYVVFLLVEIL